VNNSNLVEILGKDSSMLSNPGCTVSNFITNNNIWDMTKLQTVLNNDPIIQKILRIPIPIFEKKDTFCWGLTVSGSFTIHSAT